MFDRFVPALRILRQVLCRTGYFSSVRRGLSLGEQRDLRESPARRPVALLRLGPQTVRRKRVICVSVDPLVIKRVVEAFCAMFEHHRAARMGRPGANIRPAPHWVPRARRESMARVRTSNRIKWKRKPPGASLLSHHGVGRPFAEKDKAPAPETATSPTRKKRNFAKPIKQAPLWITPSPT